MSNKHLGYKNCGAGYLLHIEEGYKISVKVQRRRSAGHQRYKCGGGGGRGGCAEGRGLPWRGSTGAAAPARHATAAAACGTPPGGPSAASLTPRGASKGERFAPKLPNFVKSNFQDSNIKIFCLFFHRNTVSKLINKYIMNE